MPIGNEHLTDRTPAQISSQPGMAHFAGTGPVGKQCRDCARYIYNERDKDYLRCSKYRELTGEAGKAFDSRVPACKYFEERPPVLSKPSPYRQNTPSYNNQRFRS